MEVMAKELNRYFFDLLIYNLGDTHTEFVVLTNQVFTAVAEEDAIQHAVQKIENKYSEWDSLEWVITNSGKMNIEINGKKIYDYLKQGSNEQK